MSHIAGGSLLNRSEESPRFSSDIDIFHELSEAVATSAQQDTQALAANGFEVLWVLRQPLFYRAIISKGEESVKLEWVSDSAFRFFPIVPDPEFGFCLHQFDAATNKVLAAAGRNEVRDLIDLITLSRDYLPLGLLIWAACGKDPGLTPDFIIDNIIRNSAVRPEKLELELLAKPMTVHEIKISILNACKEAGALIHALPAEEIGACYLDSERDFNEPVNPLESPDSRAHYGTVGGSWPRVARAD